MTNDIQTQIEESIGTIAKAYELTNPALLVSDIKLNSKSEIFYPRCVEGECVPGAYMSADIADAFMGHICRVAKDGADFEFQPRMRIHESFKDCSILIYPGCNSLFKSAANAILSELPTDTDEMGIVCTIGNQANETGAKIVLIENATEFVGDNPQQALTLLDTLAKSQDLMIFAGFQISSETIVVNDYLFRYARNLCTLAESAFEMITEDEEQAIKPFFCLEYGYPSRKFVVYGIDEHGNTIIPAKVAQMLLMSAYGKMFATKPVRKALLVNQIFGALEGQFSKQSISNMISLAVENGTLCQSGSGNKTSISLAGVKAKKKPAYSGTIALTALGNPYNGSTKFTKKRKALCRIGEFKLIAPAKECSVNPVKNLTIELIKAVTTGKAALDFAVKTPHRNTLVIMLAEPTAEEWMHKNIGAFAKDARFDVVCISEHIVDKDLLATYRQQINSLQPDFCFILNFDRVEYTIYSPGQLAKEFAITSKAKGVTTIAQTAAEKTETLFEFDGNEFWCVKPLINEYQFCDIINEDYYNIEIPRLYSFEAIEGKFEFLCRFKLNMTLATAKEQKRVFYVGTFYWCDKTPYSELDEDCTGKPITNSVIFQAQKEGIIRVDYTSGKRSYKESVITFIGK